MLGCQVFQQMKNYSSMPAIAPIDSASIIIVMNGIWWKTVSAQDPADQRNYFMFSLQRNGRQITKSLKERQY